MANFYFDYAATSPLDPRVLAEMMPFLTSEWGNANSIHGFGRRARQAVEVARSRVAQLIGAEDPSQIFFTSGATEANNWVLKSHGRAAISPFEHSSLLEPAKSRGDAILDNQGYAILPCSERLDLVSVMKVNNEVGSIFEPARCKGIGAKLHSDLTQAVGKLRESLVEGLDYASFSAHKFYGPKGVGALYCQDGFLQPLLEGGEQEGGMRAGTLNVAGIVGMGAAAAIAMDECEADWQQACECRHLVLDSLERSDLPIVVHGGEAVSPYILSISFSGLEGETLVVEMDRQGYGISSGAACSSRSTEPSHVLLALNMESRILRGTVRISFGRGTDRTICVNLGKSLLESAQKIRTMQ